MRNSTVALVFPNFDAGGAQRQALELALALPALGWRPVALVAERRGPLEAPLAEAAIPVIDLRARLDQSKLSPAFWLNVAAVAHRIRRAAAREDACILQSFLFWQNVIAAPAAVAHPTIRAVITGRRNTGEYKDRRRHYQAVENFANRFTDAVVCNAEAVREDALRRERIDATRLRVIPNGVDLARFANAQPPSELPHELRGAGIVLGTVGNMKHQKRHDRFLEVLAALRARGVDARGLVVGRDLGEHRKLLARRATLGLDSTVAFVTDAADAAPWYKVMDLFLLTSDFEGMPNVVLEAMAAGRPVVATDAGGTRELVEEGATGFVVAPEVEPLVEKCALLAGDAALRASFGARGAQRARERFSIDAMARAYVALYEELLR